MTVKSRLLKRLRSFPCFRFKELLKPGYSKKGMNENLIYIYNHGRKWYLCISAVQATGHSLSIPFFRYPIATPWRHSILPRGLAWFHRFPFSWVQSSLKAKNRGKSKLKLNIDRLREGVGLLLSLRRWVERHSYQAKVPLPPRDYLLIPSKGILSTSVYLCPSCWGYRRNRELLPSKFEWLKNI